MGWLWPKYTILIGRTVQYVLVKFHLEPAPGGRAATDKDILDISLPWPRPRAAYITITAQRPVAPRKVRGE
jgi:hypothetical protein